MKWNVFYHSINSKDIEVLNIFDHCGFLKDLRNITKKVPEKEAFLKEVRRSLFYYFCSKCEYEILITPYPYHPDRDRAEKVDVYRQVLINWNTFSEYVWTHRKEVLEDHPYTPMCKECGSDLQLMNTISPDESESGHKENLYNCDKCGSAWKTKVVAGREFSPQRYFFG